MKKVVLEPWMFLHVTEVSGVARTCKPTHGAALEALNSGLTAPISSSALARNRGMVCLSGGQSFLVSRLKTACSSVKLQYVRVCPVPFFTPRLVISLSK